LIVLFSVWYFILGGHGGQPLDPPLSKQLKSKVFEFKVMKNIMYHNKYTFCENKVTNFCINKLKNWLILPSHHHQGRVIGEERCAKAP